MQLETKLTKEKWDLLGKEMYPKLPTISVHLVMAFCLYQFVKYIQSGSMGLAVYYIMLGVILEIFSAFIKYRRLKSNGDFFTQNYNDVPIILSYDFGREGFTLRNSTSADIDTVKYSQLVSMSETKHFLTVKADNHQSYVFDLETARANKLRELLKSKNPGLK